LSVPYTTATALWYADRVLPPRLGLLVVNSYVLVSAMVLSLQSVCR